MSKQKGIVIGRKSFEKIAEVERVKLPLTLIPGDAPPAPEVLEQAIVDLAAAWRQFIGTRVRRNTLVLLLHDISGVGKTDIKAVLHALDILEGQTLNPPRRPSAS